MPDDHSLGWAGSMDGADVASSAVIPAIDAVPATQLFAEMAGCVPLGHDRAPITLVHYGAAQGRDSLDTLRPAVAALRDRVGPNRDISVIHADVSAHELGPLHRLLETDAASYTQGDPNIFVSVIGRPCFHRLLPRDSVTLGWSADVLHWISRAPAPVPDAYHNGLSALPEVREAYARQAAEDWVRFLTHRAEELRPGGALVVSMITLGPDGQGGWDPLTRHMTATLAALIADYTITADECTRMSVPTVLRAREALLAPFDSEGRFAGLELEQIDTCPGPDPIWDDFVRDQDSRAFGQRWAAVFRTEFGPSLAGCIVPKRKACFTDGLCAGLAARFAAEPEPMPSWITRLVLTKTARRPSRSHNEPRPCQQRRQRAGQD